jgi:hypothetical protein
MKELKELQSDCLNEDVCELLNGAVRYIFNLESDMRFISMWYSGSELEKQKRKYSRLKWEITDKLTNYTDMIRAFGYKTDWDIEDIIQKCWDVFPEGKRSSYLIVSDCYIKSFYKIHKED